MHRVTIFIKFRSKHLNNVFYGCVPILKRCYGEIDQKKKGKKPQHRVAVVATEFQKGGSYQRITEQWC